MKIIGPKSTLGQPFFNILPLIFEQLPVLHQSRLNLLFLSAVLCYLNVKSGKI